MYIKENKAELRGKSGIYMIVCVANGKVYIGSAKDLWKRFYKHQKMLRDGRHPAKYMQNTWNLYGEGSFNFQIIELCEKAYLLKREQNWLDRYKPYDRELGFNTNILAHSRAGSKNSEEAKQNLSKVWTELSGLQYELISPNGEIVVGRGATSFAKEHGFSKSSVCRLIKGHLKQLKGWRLLKNKDEENKYTYEANGIVFKFLDPFKNLHECHPTQITTFCKKHGLGKSHLKELWDGKIKHHKGWHRFDVDHSAYMDFVSPSGESVSVSIAGQRYFARKYNLSETGVNLVIHGTQKTVSGWMLKTNASKIINRYKIIDPEGKELTFNCDNRSLSRFCEERNLNKKHFSSLARAERKTYAGYINPDYVSTRLLAKMKLLAA